VGNLRRGSFLFPPEPIGVKLLSKGLISRDPDSDNDFSVWERNMEFRRGRVNGWFLLGVCATNGVEDEAFMLEHACDMIGDTPQREGIQLVHREHVQE
jgi:hypothetical protein